MENCLESTATLINCIVSGNSATGSGGQGGGLWNYVHGHADQLPVSGNSADGDGSHGRGGGLYFNGGTATLTNCSVSGNDSLVGRRTGHQLLCSRHGHADQLHRQRKLHSYYGGGLYEAGNGTATLTNCTVSGNSAYSGGGLCNANGTATLTNCTVSGNSADNSGGGV